VPPVLLEERLLGLLHFARLFFQLDSGLLLSSLRVVGVLLEARTDTLREGSQLCRCVPLSHVGGQESLFLISSKAELLDLSFLVQVLDLKVDNFFLLEVQIESNSIVEPVLLVDLGGYRGQKLKVGHTQLVVIIRRGRNSACHRVVVVLNLKVIN